MRRSSGSPNSHGLCHYKLYKQNLVASTVATTISVHQQAAGKDGNTLVTLIP